MIRKNEGLILRIAPYSRTSLLVDCLVRGEGRLRFLAKGAQRPRSVFLGQLDLFYTCEVLYYHKPAGRLLVLKECAPLDNRAALREDWRAAMCASYLCDLAAQVAPPGAPHDEVLELLEGALDTLAARGGSARLLAWFDLALLDALGLAPALTRCPMCGASSEVPGPGPFQLAARGGGVLCRACLNHPDAGPRAALSGGALALLRAWNRAGRPQAALVNEPSPEQLVEILGALDLFGAYHLDLRLRSRELALELLARRAGNPAPPATR